MSPTVSQMRIRSKNNENAEMNQCTKSHDGSTSFSKKNIATKFLTKQMMQISYVLKFKQLICNKNWLSL